MKKNLSIRFTFIPLLICTFFINTLGITVPLVQAQEYLLPAPGMMVPLSPTFNPPILKGIKVHPDDPFRFDFILDKGDSQLSNDTFKDESTKLIKYFLASITIPENDLWVNLSPYEKDRIIPQSFGLTEMGRDLLAEDYILKQVTASLIYPEDEIGKKFWKRIYEEAAKRYGTTNIPVNTFNKVWIVPEKAVVYENAKAGTAYVVESKLKVMLEEDYLSLSKHRASPSASLNSFHSMGADIIREIVIPELTKEVNENKNFASLRQVYNSLILAAWYKKKIKDSILSLVYSDKNKTAGVSIDDPREKEKIYQRYLQAFKKGVYNYIKEEVVIDPESNAQGIFPRKYFSGGLGFVPANLDKAMIFTQRLPAQNLDHALVVQMVLNPADRAMNTGKEEKAVERFLAGCGLIKPLRANVWEVRGPDRRVYYLKTNDVALKIYKEFLGYHIAKLLGVNVPRMQLITKRQAVLIKGISFENEIQGPFLFLQSINDMTVQDMNTESGLENLIIFGHLMRHTDFKPGTKNSIFIDRKGKHYYVAYDLFTDFDWDENTLSRRVDEDTDMFIISKWISSSVDPKRLVDIVKMAEKIDFRKELKGALIKIPKVQSLYLLGHVERQQSNLRKNLERGLSKAADSYQGIRGQLMEIYKILSKDDAMVIYRKQSNKPESQRSTINGGIDLTPANMNVQTQNTGGKIKFHMDAAMLQQLQNAPGFAPVIISVQPLKDLSSFLGLN